MQFVKRTVLISGASSGIGRACAVSLLAQGHAVIGLSRNCQQFTTAHPGFTAFEVDLSDLTSLPQHIKQLSKQFPAIDAVIFSAGRGQFSSLEEFSFPQIRFQKLTTMSARELSIFLKFRTAVGFSGISPVPVKAASFLSVL